jgi:hypothetical protein
VRAHAAAASGPLVKCARVGRTAWHVLAEPGARLAQRTVLAQMLQEKFFLNYLLHPTRMTVGPAPLRRMATTQE